MDRCISLRYFKKIHGSVKHLDDEVINMDLP